MEEEEDAEDPREGRRAYEARRDECSDCEGGGSAKKERMRLLGSRPREVERSEVWVGSALVEEAGEVVVEETRRGPVWSPEEEVPREGMYRSYCPRRTSSAGAL